MLISIFVYVGGDKVKPVDLKFQDNASKNYASVCRHMCNERIMGSNMFWCKHSKLPWISVILIL